MSKRKVILCIMDGFGSREEVVYGNAIKNAHTPNLDYLKRDNHYFFYLKLVLVKTCLLKKKFYHLILV